MNLQSLFSEANVGLLIVQMTMLVGHVLAYLSARKRASIDGEIARSKEHNEQTREIEQHADEVADRSRELFVNEFRAIVELNEALRDGLALARRDISEAREEARETRARVDVLIDHVGRLEAQLIRHGVEVPPRPSFDSSSA